MKYALIFGVIILIFSALFAKTANADNDVASNEIQMKTIVFH